MQCVASSACVGSSTTRKASFERGVGEIRVGHVNVAVCGWTSQGSTAPGKTEDMQTVQADLTEDCHDGACLLLPARVSCLSCQVLLCLCCLLGF